MSTSSDGSSANEAASSQASSAGSDCVGVEKLCRRVHRKLAVSLQNTLSVAEHQTAVRAMLAARDAVLRGVELTPAAHTSLLCSGVAVLRRTQADVETEESVRLLKTTLALIFSLLVLSEGHCELEQDEFEETPNKGPGTENHKPRRIARESEELLLCRDESALADSVLGETTTQNSSWSTLVRSNEAVGKAALQEARHVRDPQAMVALQDLATTFFRCKASYMLLKMLSEVETSGAEVTGGKRGAASFLTLDTVSMLNEANEMQSDKLASIVDAAESEAGQATLRDIILSFKLPRSVVGVRRVLSLPRMANAIAVKSYTEILNSAHETAMRGAAWSWTSNDDQIHKISAVLAGLAVILAKTSEAIRKGDAFAGRIILPFIECIPPGKDVVRLGLVEETGEWVVFSVKDTGTPRVRFRGTGFNGFCEAALLFSRNVQT